MSKRYVGRHRAPQGSGSVGGRAVQAGAIVLLSGGLVNTVVDTASADPAPSSPASQDPAWEPSHTDPRPAEPAEESDAPAPDPSTSDSSTPEPSTPSPTPTPERTRERVEPPPSTPRTRPVHRAPKHHKKSVNRRTPVATPRRPVEPTKTSGVLGTAASLSGIPYRWGGTSTSGFDCSGYTRHVFRKNGVSLPRTAAAQQRATRRVFDPRPGDLVFFGSPAHHVGIYAGNGKMYDAPRTGRTTGLHRIWSTNVTYGRP